MRHPLTFSKLQDGQQSFVYINLPVVADVSLF